MEYRRLGKTELMVSEIGFGGEWLDGKTFEEGRAIADKCMECGINIVDCWMSDPEVRSNLGNALAGRRNKWYIQGHIGSTWQKGQYKRTRDLAQVKPAFEDLLERLGTDYVDLGMIHYVDDFDDLDKVLHTEFIDYVKELKESGKIRHIGMSTHNPLVAAEAVKSGVVEMIMFSINPAFDLMPPTDNVDKYFEEGSYSDLAGNIAPERAELYKLCEINDVGITVMKGFAGGRLFDDKLSPFGVAFTPVQCLHYCLTRPAVAAVMAGFKSPEEVEGCVAYETASDKEKDYEKVLAKAPHHAFTGQCTYCGHCAPCPMDIDIATVCKFHDLALMQPEVPASVREHYKALKHPADECYACRMCHDRCPFHVDIVKIMRKCKLLFN
ncbi:MAG: aldo/keto reductase [Lachnospiraceae bacterium]|nr:aldo/keto reductase [Lachnospiraceae bacterium]